MGSITEPAHAEDCIAVGSTHREAPHAFGVTWTSSKGPTLDGRMKPDVVAPGEWIASAASGEVRAEAGWTRRPQTPAGWTRPAAGPVRLTYAEQSGTSMAAPHVSGVIAAFLSVRPEFIGRRRWIALAAPPRTSARAGPRWSTSCACSASPDSTDRPRPGADRPNRASAPRPPPEEPVTVYAGHPYWQVHSDATGTLDAIGAGLPDA